MVLGEVRAIGGRLARARDARLRVDDHVARQQAGVRERQQREQRGRRIAARAGHQARGRKGRAAPLRQRVERAVRQRGGLRVPARPKCAVSKPERARQIDHPHTAPGQRGANTGGRRLGQAQKHDVAFARERVHIERLNLAVPDAREGRQPPRFSTRGHGRRQSDSGMPGQQADQFLAGVTGGPGDGDTNRRWRQTGSVAWSRVNKYALRFINSQACCLPV